MGKINRKNISILKRFKLLRLTGIIIFHAPFHLFGNERENLPKVKIVANSK